MANCIHIIDYKHGKGIAVEVGEVLTITHEDVNDLMGGDFTLGYFNNKSRVLRHANGQLMQYGLGALLKQPKGFDGNIVLTIVQPRAFHPDGPIRSIEISAKDLIRWGTEVLVPAGKATLQENAPLVAGEDQCRWCPAKGQCSALFDKTNEIAINDFKDESFPDPRVLTEEQMMLVMDHADLITSFCKAVTLESKSRMDSGNTEFEGRYKLVRSRTNRKLTSDAIDELALYTEEENLYNKKLKGLGDIEELLKPDYTKTEIKEIMQEVTTKEPGQTVIAPMTDKRKSIESSVTSDFDDYEL